MKKTYLAAALCGTVLVSGLASAQTFEEQMEVQGVLQDLDWQIQIRERQIKAEQLSNDLNAIKKGEEINDRGNQNQNNGNTQVFGFGQQAPNSGQGVEQIPLTAEEIAANREAARKAENELDREVAISFVEQMALIEAYKPNDKEELEAVINTRRGLKTVSKGEEIGDWTVANVGIQSVEFVHQTLRLEKELRHIR
jgi:hypothetical protein